MFKEPKDTVGTGTHFKGTPKEETPKEGEIHYGLKKAVASPMTRGEHSKSKGFPTVLGGDASDVGFKVVYEDGYESWLPKVAFLKDFKASGELSFGMAVRALEEGKKVARTGWNGKNLFIFMQIPNKVDMKFIPKMSSLPNIVKETFIDRQEKGKEDETFKSVTYQNQIALVKSDNSIHGWTPSSEDVFAKDWVII